ncbi:glycosyl hydrolase family 25 [Levilactobacillus zymae]|uniref:Glycosyl hydrolase family 25 n=1 Tax=Levilactobacillus zymae TaxID=267363 RepID=A0ABQ0X0I4_9LACO|nr:GH25 family lysozyme [Levilactobacillus zymae]KRL15042.1 Lyzozyme M1 (1,4-beta-N-acetylmuramidase) [Levilactobacillus zymae DSM 19395]QFR61621.1 glycosyl hydrolase family 25 [Levilactobacillus zymae]GEO72756.1 glycosyl hydrolase family 25 [Levilactobacillus zymae]
MRKIRHQTWQKRTAQLVALLGVAAGLAGGGQVVAHASSLAVPDISEWQGKLSATQVANLKNQVSFVINRRQYGSGYQDKDATNNTNLYTQYGIPFGEYDYARFTSASSAKQEAQTFYNRSNKNAQFYVLDFEEDDVTAGSTNSAVQAWLNEMRSLTNKHVIFYSYQSFATTYANAARQNFDAQWIANYSYQPTIPMALWQYTDHNYLAALNEYTDNSKVITSVHPVTWWADDSVATALTHNSTGPTTPATSATGTSTTSTVAPATPAAPARVSLQKGQRAYLHRHAVTLTGAAVAKRNTQKLYTISRVKANGTAVYLKGLNQWVKASSVTGYWAGSHRTFKLTHKLNLYTSAALTRRTGSYYVTGDTVTGKLVKSPNGRAYRIKTKLGYLTANVKDSTLA